MSDVDPKSISPQQKQAVETYVKELGGGFILAGGENTYGKDGYSDTPIEKALPVTFDTKKRPPTIAMVAVIDVSGSMSQGQLTIAKEAAKAPLKALRNSDRFGVLSFNTGYNWVAPIQYVSNRPAINAGIESLYAGGGTNVYVGLNAAFQALKDAPDEVKTVLVLSDGITQTADFQALSTSMIKSGINVSTIAVGTAANRELMADIAMWGKGRAYNITTYDRVPQIFIKETELALGKTLQEQPFLPILKKNVEAFKGIDFAKAPRLLGYVVTKAKPTSEVLLTESWTDEPLLARWQYGLGKAAIFTSDVKTRWAADWIEWNGYAKFWAQVIRETMRRRNDEQFDFKVTRKGDFALISINAVEKNGQFRNDLEPQVRVIGPDQKVTVLDVPQVGPGGYENRVALNRGWSLLLPCQWWRRDGIDALTGVFLSCRISLLSTRHAKASRHQQCNGRKIRTAGRRNLRRTRGIHGIPAFAMALAFCAGADSLYRRHPAAPREAFRNRTGHCRELTAAWSRRTVSRRGNDILGRSGHRPSWPGGVDATSREISRSFL